MFEYLKARRSLKREIEEAEKEFMRLAKNESLDLLTSGVDQNRFLRDHYKMELKILESNHLLDVATRKFGLDVSLGKVVYDPKMHGVEQRTYLEEPEKLLRMISKARFEWWKKWIELLVPILSLLIAIIVLLKK